MAVNRVLISPQILTDVAEAIREKTGIDDKLKPSEFAEYILLIDGGKVYRYYDSWRGLISPMDGTFQQAYYNNGIAVDDKIYFMRNYGHSHYNGDSLAANMHTRWFCYDTTNNTCIYTVPICEGETFFCSSMWKGSDGAIYGFGYPYRYKTTDCGVTWTRDEMTTPQYDPCPVYKLSNGRIIGTMLARTKMLMISDDEGLTWTTITPFTDEVFAEAGISGGTLSMSHGTICELDDCLALYFNSPMSVDDNTSKRYVSLSYDNGDTWTAPVACSGDLAEAGWYISPGSIVCFGNKYHYFVSNRYKNLKYSEDESYYLIGDLKWFIGTADDVKNGTMTLKKVLSETLCTGYGFDATMAAQDVGNGGATLCNGALYVNHGNLVYNKDDATRKYVSNSGIEMFRIGLEDEEDAEPYWDANFKAKYEEMLSAKSTDYNYYFYSPDNTNINAVDWWGYEEKGYLPNEGSFKLPLGTGNFEINGILNCGYLSLSRGFPNIFAGVESTDGTLHAIGSSDVGKYGIFDKANDGVPSGVLGGGDATYFTFKRENGVDTYTINGVTVTNPPFGWTKGTDGVILGVTEPSFIYNINADDETVQTWLDGKPATWNICGFSMLTISCDADYHGTHKDYSVTYNLEGCTSSNKATGVNEGKPYQTTITADIGYELSGDIICTMGGGAQTVTDGVINIESVTGDIVITAIATEIVTEPVTDGLTMCYSMDSYDADANTWTDECGIGNTVTPSGFNTEQNMVSGSNMKLLDMQTFSNLFSNGWTLSLSYYAASVANNMFALNATGAGNGYPSSLPPTFKEVSNDSNSIYVMDGQYIKNTKRHYAWTYDPDTGLYAMYFNGTLVGTTPKTTDWNKNTTSWFILGGWGGHFGDVRVYNRALTSEEVNRNYAYDGKTWSFDA